MLGLAGRAEWIWCWLFVIGKGCDGGGEVVDFDVVGGDFLITITSFRFYLEWTDKATGCGKVVCWQGISSRVLLGEMGLWRNCGEVERVWFRGVCLGCELEGWMECPGGGVSGRGVAMH